MSEPPREAAGGSTKQPAHPLRQIAESPTYRLLLKQWLKEEDLISRRTAVKESRLDAVRREITALYCSFFIFHAISLLLLFAGASLHPSAAACRRSWVPCFCSLLCSMTIVWAIRYKTDDEAHIRKLVEREREDGLLLGKCVEELKRKGVEFDLLKEVDALRRAKSLRVEANEGSAMGARRWTKRDFALMFLLVASCGVLASTRFVLCQNY
ncbi:hypothetical protein AXF42_Ash020383 [Apostasia shenzhenica]|uniref:Uncharacterized protein n=1 Tax=Apostasia shenzhenica TaxID=1088818 RepID=A0A2I0A3Q1_9ASPA|nr:hypothetical protein AXF42_Ash020383 [Apostasia shenzhenica]